MVSVVCVCVCVLSHCTLLYIKCFLLCGGPIDLHPEEEKGRDREGIGKRKDREGKGLGQGGKNGSHDRRWNEREREIR
jgi:hypothetical protein